MKKVIPILISLSLIVTMTACTVNKTVSDHENAEVVDDITAEQIEDIDTA